MKRQTLHRRIEAIRMLRGRELLGAELAILREIEKPLQSKLDSALLSIRIGLETVSNRDHKIDRLEDEAKAAAATADKWQRVAHEASAALERANKLLAIFGPMHRIAVAIGEDGDRGSDHAQRMVEIVRAAVELSRRLPR